MIFKVQDNISTKDEENRPLQRKSLLGDVKDNRDDPKEGRREWDHWNRQNC